MKLLVKPPDENSCEAHGRAKCFECLKEHHERETSTILGALHDLYREASASQSPVVKLAERILRITGVLK